MRTGINRHPPLVIGGIIAETVGGPGVREFVQREADDQADQAAKQRFN
jgi:hypothetical protein